MGACGPEMTTAVRLLLLLVGTFLGVVLAWLMATALRDLVLPVACILFVGIIAGFYVWIVRGGLKR